MTSTRPERMRPCTRCGGSKEGGIRGARLCNTCRQDMEPIWQQRERERSSIKGRNQRRAAGIPQRAKKFNEDGQIWCARCAEYLPANRFRVFKTGKKAGQPATYCRRCSKAYAHEQRLKNVFGITAEQYDELLRIQDGRCAICRDRPLKFQLAVDHNHQTGKIRGLLCKRCNHELLGAARDEVEILERAICYLESPPADTGLPVVIHEDFERHTGLIRRFGDKWAAVFDVDDFAQLLRDAGVTADELTVVSHEPIPESIAIVLREATWPDWDPPMAAPTDLAANHPTRRTLRQRAGIE